MATTTEPTTDTPTEPTTAAPAGPAGPLPCEMLANHQYVVTVPLPAALGADPVAFVELPETLSHHPLVAVLTSGRPAAVASIYVDRTETVEALDAKGVPEERHGWLRVYLGATTAPAQDTEALAVLQVIRG